MDFATSIFLAMGLATDAFAVSLCAGSGGRVNDMRSRLRLAFHFGVFQTGMTVLGWVAGTRLVVWIEEFDHWVALGLLSYVGIGMIRPGLLPGGRASASNPSKGKTLVMLCLATSLDALAVGLSLGMLTPSIFSPAALIGIVTFTLSAFGLLVGARLGGKFGPRAEIVGGLVLLIIGLRVVLADLYL